MTTAAGNCCYRSLDGLRRTRGILLVEPPTESFPAIGSEVVLTFLAHWPFRCLKRGKPFLGFPGMMGVVNRCR